jgi:hypothetical protein
MLPCSSDLQLCSAYRNISKPRTLHTCFLLTELCSRETTGNLYRRTKYPYVYPDANVLAVTLHIKSKKNDQAGNGFRFYFTRALPGETYCIVQTLWGYLIREKPARGRSLFYIPGLDWTLKPPHLTQELRRLAVVNGLDPDRVFSHSLRSASGVHLLSQQQD